MEIISDMNVVAATSSKFTDKFKNYCGMRYLFIEIEPICEHLLDIRLQYLIKNDDLIDKINYIVDTQQARHLQNKTKQNKLKHKSPLDESQAFNDCLHDLRVWRPIYLFAPTFGIDKYQSIAWLIQLSVIT